MKIAIPVEQAVKALPDRETVRIAVDCARMAWPTDYVVSRLTDAPEILVTDGQAKNLGYGLKFHNGQDWCFVEADPDRLTANAPEAVRP